MTLHKLLQTGRQRLQECIAESDLDGWLLMEYVFGIDRNYYILHMEEEAGAAESQRYLELIAQRCRHVPLQHLTGVQEFMGMEFFVNEHVLIPRQDTEILVEEAEKHLGGCRRVLDLCTGSGCILLSLIKRNKGLEGVGADISEQALAVAAKNMMRHGVKAELIQGNLFDNIEGGYDMIISNPPYIPSAEIESLMEEVKLYEPAGALDGKADGLFFYREIVRQAPRYLSAGGWLLFEIGCGQGEEVSLLLEEQGYECVEVVTDLAGLDRVVKGQLSTERSNYV